MTIVQIQNSEEKKKIARRILEALTEWFELEAGRETFIADSADQIFLAAQDGDTVTGFLCLKETGRHTAEIAVMGVEKEYQRRGIGRQLVEKAKKIAGTQGYSFLQVKTVQSGSYESYDKTNLFYIGCGFKEFEVFPTLWDEANPCQVYVMSLQ